MRRTASTLALAALAAAAVLAARGGAAQEHHHAHAHDAGDLGEVDFPITCAEPVRAAFTRGVALLHSFGYEDAREAFAAAAAEDPECGIAHWGLAMSWYHPLWSPPSPAELEAGRAAAERAAQLGAGSDRERGYIAAIGAFYRDAGTLDHRTRALAYGAAMEDLARRFPDDHEAAILHALALLGTAPPSDTTYAQQKRAAEILNRLLPEEPRHPGIAHYLIHSFDYPALAPLALDAARAYASIAPSSAHAQHMPSHIFTRLGLWPDSIASNLASAASGRAAAARRHPGAESFDALHALDYLVYAYLQIGDEEKARAARAEGARAKSFDEPNFAAGFALAAMPARFALERRRWAEAAALTPPSAPLPWDRFPYALAPTHFARTLGAARAGDLTRARAALADLAAVEATLAANPIPGPYDWTGHVAAQRLAAEGWLAHAEGRDEAAVALLVEAAERDEAVGKHPVTPGAILPPRELLADLLLELGRPADALREYEAALRAAPDRFNALYGAATAAAAAGDPTRARELYARLVAQCDGAPGARPELARAREQVAAR
jgi:tetratricopeptide (TPR) repeat protein